MTDLTFEAYDHLVGLAYAAGGNPARWSDFVAALDAEIDGAYLSLYGFDVVANLSTGTITSRFSEEYLAHYETHFARVNPFLSALRHARPLDIRFSQGWVPQATLEQTEFYNDFLMPQDGIGGGVGGVLANEEGALLILSGHFRHTDEDRIAPRLMRVLRLLSPHVRRAFQMQRGLEGQAALEAGIATALDRVRNSVFLLDEARKMRFANEVGRAALQRSPGLWLDRMGSLVFRDAKANAMLRRATSGPASGAAVSFVVPLAEGLRVAARFDPLGPSEPGEPLPAVRGRDGDPVVMLVVLDADLDADAVCRHLANLYGLTPVEQILALGIARGESLDEIGERRAVSRHTLRNQLKSIYSKTGFSRQAELSAAVRKLDG